LANQLSHPHTSTEVPSAIFDIANKNDPLIDDLWVYHGLPIKHVKFLQFPEVNSSIFDPSLVALTVRLAASREEGRGAAGSDTATESCRPRGLNHPGGMIRICYHP